MKNICIIDITGRGGYRYNCELCNALQDIVDEKTSVYNATPDIVLSSPSFKYIKFFKIVPEKYRQSRGSLKRILMTLEVMLNYLYLAFALRKRGVKIAHFEWLPFVEFIGIDYYFLRLLKLINPGLNLFYTVHNIFPHNLPETKKNDYIRRITKLNGILCKFMVHTHHSRTELSKIYDINLDRIGVAYHGIYKPEISVTKEEKKSGEVRFFMYGIQDYYKGADILMEALKQLPEEYISKSKTYIIGKTPAEMLDNYKESLKTLNVTWVPGYYELDELKKGLQECDYVILPYRAISQSAVLLEMIYLTQPVIVSNLPSFVETLEGYPQNLFFNTNDSQDLSSVLKRVIDLKIDVNNAENALMILKQKYSWNTSAKQNLKIYKESINI